MQADGLAEHQQMGVLACMCAEAAWHWQCEQFVGDDEVTSACMHGDRRRADEWRAGWAGPVPRVSLRPDQALSAQQLPQQQQQQRSLSGGASVPFICYQDSCGAPVSSHMLGLAADGIRVRSCTSVAAVHV